MKQIKKELELSKNLNMSLLGEINTLINEIEDISIQNKILQVCVSAGDCISLSNKIIIDLLKIIENAFNKN